jgi:hypothetical protein
MHDSFLLLTPLLVVPIVGLFGFGGCRYHFDPIAAPTGLTVDPRCIWIYVKWNKADAALTYDLVRNDDGNEQVIYQGPDTNFRDTFVVEVNHNYPSYKVRSVGGPNFVSDYSPLAGPALMSQALLSPPQGYLSLEYNYTGYIGVEIQTDALLNVCALGRFVAPGDGTNSDPAKTGHWLKIVDAVRGTDVDGSQVYVNTVPGSPHSFFDPTDSFVYGLLPQPISLMKDDVNTEGRFYVVSQEVDLSGDPYPERWGDGDTPVLSAAGAVVLGSVRGNAGSWTRQRSGSFSFGPVNFLYQVPIG